MRTCRREQRRAVSCAQAGRRVHKHHHMSTAHHKADVMCCRTQRGPAPPAASPLQEGQPAGRAQLLEGREQHVGIRGGERRVGGAGAALGTLDERSDGAPGQREPAGDATGVSVGGGLVGVAVGLESRMWESQLLFGAGSATTVAPRAAHVVHAVPARLALANTSFGRTAGQDPTAGRATTREAGRGPASPGSAGV